MTKLINNEVISIIKYGILTIETSKGELTYEYSTGVNYDTHYSPEDIATHNSLSGNEQNEIDEIISNEIK